MLLAIQYVWNPADYEFYAYLRQAFDIALLRDHKYVY
jgi:hypothetical protein